MGNRDTRDRRRTAIQEILGGPEPMKSQRQLAERLEEMGFGAAQASLSRDLQAIGAIRMEGRYQIQSWTPDEQALRRASPLLEEARTSGPYLTVVRTAPGAGKAVARALETAAWPEVRGMVADDSTLFIATADLAAQKQLFYRLKRVHELMWDDRESQE